MSLGTSQYFIGARDYDGDGNFTWVNGDSLSNDDNLWNPGQPNGDGDCCRAYFDERSGKIFDGSCSVQQLGVCERLI